MKILIVGGGGREHALAWKLSQSPKVKTIYASPGNPGIASVATCLSTPSNIEGYAELAERIEADMTVVGPEAPLVAGIVDAFRARGLNIVGPTATAARLEGSKIFAKQFFERAGIPTARSATSINVFSFPVVIKADGLAAGKGVVIAQNRAEAEEAIGRLGPAVVIEEFLEGEEVSFMGLSDGDSILPFAPAQDHKRIYDGDLGPNTGGMGAYCDGRILSEPQRQEVIERVMLPAIRQMRREGSPFTGFLYAGLMMTADGPKVLEFNVRLGDPEAQALLYSFEGDLADLLIGGVPDAASARGGRGGGWAAAGSRGSAGAGVSVSVKGGESGWGKPTVCIVAAAGGYPENPRTGDEISGLEEAEAEGATIFQAGTRHEGEKLITSGGRVLGVTARAETLPEAVEAAYRAMKKIHFQGMQYRTDIARKGLRRWYTAGRAGT